MKKVLVRLFLSFITMNSAPLYADALDNLVNQKQTEKAEQKKQKQQKEEQVKKQEQLLIDIADCEQAVAKATEKRNSISDEETYVINPYVAGANKDGIINNVAIGMSALGFGDISVADFAKDGVFISVYLDNWKRYFIYTKDTDYINNEKFREQDFIYKSAGNYKYTTITGATNSVRAFKATKHRVSEIDPKTYLQNKSLSCCQYYENDFKEVGVIRLNDCSDGWCLYPRFVPYYSSVKCRTKNHPKGMKNDDHRSFIITGTNYYNN